MTRRKEKIIAYALSYSVMLGIAAYALGIIGFTYPRVIENQPLDAPVKVVSLQDQTMTLEDGRVLALDRWLSQANWQETLKLSDGCVDVVENGSGVTLYGTREGWVCGTPWAFPIRIPLIPQKVYRNKREPVAFGAIVAAGGVIERGHDGDSNAEEHRQ